MLGWLKRLFVKRCEFYNKCELKKDNSSSCNSGPTYFDGIGMRSYCGKYRILAGWDN